MSFFSSFGWIAISFLFFTVLVAVVAAWKTKGDNLETAEGYFLAGRGLPGVVIAGSLLLTNLSAEQLVGTNGQGWGSNMSPIGWEDGNNDDATADGSAIRQKNENYVFIGYRYHVFDFESASYSVLRCGCI